jgi:hypothetical protein
MIYGNQWLASTGYLHSAVLTMDLHICQLTGYGFLVPPTVTYFGLNCANCIQVESARIQIEEKKARST